jgi:peptide/nickel transport system permease protein
VRGLERYVLRRLLGLVPVVLWILALNFVLIHVAPGDPVQILAGDFAATPEYAARIRAEYGLDQPLWMQALRYFGRFLRGDLGYSIAFRQPVLDLILARLWPTVLLGVSGLGIATVAGILLGILAARRAGSALDAFASSVALFGYSVPVFWLGQILLVVFALHLRWFPAQGMYSLRTVASGWPFVLDIAMHLALPALTLGALQLAVITRLMRASLLETLGQEFVRTARAKGLAEAAVVYRHALRNAILPVVTMIGISVGTLLGGAVLTETVYGWPGLGRLLYESVLKRDYPVMMGILAVISLSVGIANLVTDLLYGILDPRIRYGGRH